MSASPSSSVAHPALSNGAKKPLKTKMEKFTFTLGKLDAGMAILLGPNAHLLEFPSLLLPSPSPGTPPLGPGSILTITVSRDVNAELAAQQAFTDLQDTILRDFTRAPIAPKLKARSVTQTSVVLEWPKLDLGSAGFRSLEMYKNGQRWGRVGGDYGKRERNEWKTGGLQVGEEYSYQLVLKTSAGQLSSNVLKVRTHTMDNLTGLQIHFGPLEPPGLLKQLRTCLSEIGAKETTNVGLDTTHFVCTSPIISGHEQNGGAVSRDYAEAIQMNLPIVGPGWLLAVATERKLIPISNYLLPALPANVPVADAAPPFKRPEPLKRASLPFTSSVPGSPVREEPMRSPSPETIARMSMMQTVAGASSSPSRSPLRSSSYDEQRDDPYSQDRPRSRQSTLPLEKRERPRSREASLPVEAEATRPRSPKPEADGKLDRGFKFPLQTSPTAATGSNIDSALPVDSPAATVTAEPALSDIVQPAGYHPEDVPSQETEPFAPKEAAVPSDSTASAPPPLKVDIPSTVSAASIPAKEEQEKPIAPTPPVASPAPGSAPVATSPNDETSKDSRPRASTIDEAIANFHDAVEAPPAPIAAAASSDIGESVAKPSQTEKDAVAKDAASDEKPAPASKSAKKRAKKKAANGNK